jgi:inorganic pyrophosphatase
MKLPGAFVKDTSDEINVIIETPAGCGSKYDFDVQSGFFKLSKILPQGMVFPAHFGFIPNTMAEDGDPLDVLVLMDEISYPGNLIECQVLGVIEAEQREKSGESVRNDRIVAAATLSHRYVQIGSLRKLDQYLVDEITKFFINYNAISGKKFTPLAYSDAAKAIKLIRKQLTGT